MRRFMGWCSFAILSAAIMGVSVQAAEKSITKETNAFGTLTAPSEVSVRVKAFTWLTKTAGKTDDATRTAFDALWANKEMPVLDKLSGTFSLGDPTVAKMLAEARNANTFAATTLPGALKDTSKDIIVRANLALAYAKALSNRKVYEEALETFNMFKPEQVVDPASFMFHKAVAEHALLKKTEANTSIARLLDDVPSAPERYKLVAALMHFDMVTWKDKDLGAIGRMMDIVQRRLDLTRGGKETQKIQKEIVARLDELIKELENQDKDGDCDCTGGKPGSKPGQAKGNKPGNTNQPSSPQNDSNGGTNGGPGQVDQKRIDKLAEQWGKLPAREREAQVRELTRDMPARYAEVIREYFRKLSQQSDDK